MSCKAASQAPADVASVSLLPEQTPLGFGAHGSTPGPHLPGRVERPKGGGSLLSPPQPIVTLVWDASALGCGAHFDYLRTQGLWSREEFSQPINIRELRAVRLACRVFLPQISGRVMQVRRASTVPMFYINKQGVILGPVSGGHLSMGLLREGLHPPRGVTSSGSPACTGGSPQQILFPLPVRCLVTRRSPGSSSKGGGLPG